MATDFEKLTPGDLRKAAIVPQVLDNQWVPRKTLGEMIRSGKGLADVKLDRQNYVLKEWRRALVYGEQAIVNRAFMFNNAVVVDDYDDFINREYFKQLLRTKVIVPYLFTEDSPDQKPSFHVNDKLWNAWMDIIHDTHLSCVRLDWGDQTDDFKRLSKIFHNYIQTLNTPDQAKHLANHFGIGVEEFPAFRDRLKEIAFCAFQMANNDRYITRNDLYKEFVCIEGSNIADGRYSNKPFVSQIKQIADLKYNVNLPDALGRYALTPEDSPPRSALGDLDEAIRGQSITDENVKEILFALRRLSFDQISQGLYLKSLGSLGLNDVITVRDTDEWEAYRQAMNRLLDNPLDFPQGSADLYSRFEALNRAITRIRIEKDKSKWEPWVKFMISVGTHALVLLLNPADFTQKLLTVMGTGAVTVGVTPFLMRMTVTALTETDADLDISLDFMRGTVRNGRDVWNEMLGQLRSTPGFEILKKSLSEKLDANQSPAEDMGD